MKKILTSEFARLVNLGVASIRNQIRAGQLIPSDWTHRGFAIFTMADVKKFKIKQENALKERERRRNEKEKAKMLKPKKYTYSDLSKELGVPYSWIWHLKVSGRLSLPVSEEEKQQLKKEYKEKKYKTTYGQKNIEELEDK